MNNVTRIQLIGAVQGYLDVQDNTAFPLNFSVADIRDISKKNGTFSKSITLAGSKNNHKLLNHYFDVNIQAGNFNINSLQRCAIVQNGITILDNATMQLISVNKTQLNGSYEESITYTVLIKDSTATFFGEISNHLLTDLDFSDFNHKYTGLNVIASYDNTFEDGYKYIVPYAPTSSGRTVYDLLEFTPGIYAKQYFDRIFSNAGFSYSWPTYNSDEIMFDKLIIPYNGDDQKPTESQIDFLTVIAEKTTSQFIGQNDPNLTSNTLMGFNTSMTVNTEIQDNESAYNTATSEYTLPVALGPNEYLEYEYTVNYTMTITNSTLTTVTLKSSTGGGTIAGGINYYPIIINRKGVNNVTNNVTTPDLGVNLGDGVAVYDILNVPTSTAIPASSALNVVANKTVIFKSSSPNWTIGDISKNAFGVNYRSGNSSAQYGWYNPSNVRQAVNYTITINSIEQTIKPVVKNVKYNSPVLLNSYIPKQIKQSDFIKSIFTMFNIFVEVNKDNPKQLILTPRDEYYDNGIIKDWTKKLAKDKAQDLQFLPELQTKKLVLTYKEDKDAPNTTYLAATNEVYGQQEYVFDNQYVKDKTKQELIFSPSPMINTKFGAVVPFINGRAPKTLPRILIDGGVYDCGPYNILQYAGAADLTTDIYPHISHWDKPFNPTFDINFGLCDYYYRTDDYGSDPASNLFNLHWRRTLNQINTGKLLTAYFNLNEIDIQSLRLSDKIRIDNSWWNINKVIDYDANAKKLTKVELISIDDNLKIPYKTKTVSRTWRDYTNWQTANEVVIRDINNTWTVNDGESGVGVWGRGNYFDTDVTAPVGVWGNNNTVYGNTSVFGNDNTVSANDSFVVGSFNDIQSNARSSMIVGSGNTVSAPSAVVFGEDNTIDSGASGTFIIGTGISATTSNTLYTNNIIMTAGATINGQSVETIVNGSTFWVSGSGSNSIYAVTSTVGGASGQDSLAINNDTYANGIGSMAQGVSTSASGNYSHTEGSNTLAAGNNSHAEGETTQSIGVSSHAEGLDTISTGDYSHAEGDGTESIGIGSHAEGYLSKSNGTYSHAEGIQSNASGEGSHAEGGSFTLGLTGGTASGIASKASGVNTLASGILSIAEGTSSIASGDISYASGFGSVASRYGEWARSSFGPSSEPAGGEGQYGIVDYNRTTNNNTITEIFIGGTSPQRLTIQSGSSYRFKVTVLARIVSTSAVKEWEGNGLIKNVYGTTSMVGSAISSTFGDAGLAAATVTLSADNTNDSLKVEVTGIAATQIVWYAKVEYVQIY